MDCAVDDNVAGRKGGRQMGIVFSTVGAVLLKLFLIVLFLVIFLLLFVLVMVCLVLFCPVRYKGVAEYDGNLMAKGKVTWLCSLLSVSFSYQEGKTDSKIRILGIDLIKFLEKRQKRKEDSKEQSSGEEKKAKNGKSREKQTENQPNLHMNQIEERFSAAPISEDKPYLKEKMPDLEVSQLPEEREPDQTDWTAREEQGREKAGQPEKSKINLFFRHMRELPQFFWRKIQGFFDTLRKIFTKIRRKAEWLGQIREFWKSENTQGMVCILKNNVLHLLRKIKPRVLRGTIFFGTGDPCMTGQILGVAAILYAVYGKGIQVVPDFEEARLEGELYAKGRLFLITMVFIVIKIFRSNEWKQFKYDLDQLKEAL